jgi:hypothetical protein
MAGEQVLYNAAMVLGLAGGALAWRSPESGRSALGLSLIPFIGLGLGTAFC